MRWIPYILVVLLATSCEKEIDIDLPQYTSKVVVEGSIETGAPPLVFLTSSHEFFGTTDLNAFQNSFIPDATVIVSDGVTTDTLDELCTQSLPPGYDTLVANFLGIDVDDLSQFNICAYVSLNTALFGQVGRQYKLTIHHDGETYTSSTRIPELVPLDSVWFETQGTSTTHGFAWARMDDPDTSGNGYRWFARRLNLGNDGNPKDPQFQPPFGSAFDDEFLGGVAFDFAYNRPESDNDEPGDEYGYYRIGDTVAVKFCTIDIEAVDFLRTAEAQAFNNGSPFASPANNPTNIEGGALGLWVGYGVTYDTLIAQ